MKRFLSKISPISLLVILGFTILGAEMLKDYLIGRQVDAQYAVPYHNKEAVSRFQACLGDEMRGRVNFVQMFGWDEPRRLNDRWFAAENACKVVLARFDWANQASSEKHYNAWRRDKPVEYPYLIAKAEENVAQYPTTPVAKKTVATAKVKTTPKNAPIHNTTTASRPDPNQPTKVALR